MVILPILTLNRKNQTGTVRDVNDKEKIIIRSAQLSRAEERAKISISAMPMEQYFLALILTKQGAP
jgi:hypothetical protein